MGFLRRWLGGRSASVRSPEERIEAVLAAERSRYEEARSSTAACLYVVHKLGGEVARQKAIAADARDAARRALADADTLRSRSMVARARTALDLATETEQRRDELRERAERACESLRSLATAIAELERERLYSIAARAVPHPDPEVEHARRTLAVLSAERELELELG